MAINRTPGSLFDSLKDMSMETNRSGKKEQPKTTQKKAVNKSLPKTTSIDADKPISTQKEEPIASESISSIKAFDFGEEKVKKEIKSVRKQFVFTPTYAKWLNDTAKLNNISENLVIERLMERAMNS